MYRYSWIACAFLFFKASFATADPCPTVASTPTAPSWLSAVAIKIEDLSQLCSQTTVEKLLEAEVDQAFRPRSTKRSSWAGLALEDHPEKLKILEDSFEGFPEDVIQAKASGCTTAVCVFEKVIGSHEAALRALTMKSRTGYILSFKQEDESGKFKTLSIWAADEVKKLDQSLRIAPPELLQLKSMREFRRANYFFEHTFAYSVRPGFGKPGYIIFFPLNWYGEIGRTVLHELSHHYDYSHGSPTYHHESGFDAIYKNSEKDVYVRNETTGELELKKPRNVRERFVSLYAQFNDNEDFAETFSYYIVDPNQLRLLANEKYEFIKTHVMNGREFGQEKPISFEKLVELDAFAQATSKCFDKIQKVSDDAQFFESPEGEPFSISQNQINEPYFKSKNFIMEKPGCLIAPVLEIKGPEAQSKVCLSPREQNTLDTYATQQIANIYSEFAAALSNVMTKAKSEKWNYVHTESALKQAIGSLKSLGFFSESGRNAVASALFSVASKTAPLIQIKNVNK